MTLLRQWSLASTAPQAASSPAALVIDGSWLEAEAPGTVASALRSAGLLTLEQGADLDDRDWWYRCSFEAAAAGTRPRFLHFHGLATLAQIWLNGELLLQTDNMFRRYTIDVGDQLQGCNEVVICFRALNTALAQRRPRPRWKTRLVRHQQLRWIRTSLLGRIPGWTPRTPPIGPWRAIELEEREPFSLVEPAIHTKVENDAGIASFEGFLASDCDAAVSATLHVAGVSSRLEVTRENDRYRVHGSLLAPGVARWWPHTHGDPVLHPAILTIEVDGTARNVDLGRIGFRSIDVQQDDGDFAVRVNGQGIFCRGACWTTEDIVTLGGTREQYRRTLTLMRDAGANMIRVGGTMVYESGDFYELCDELGILVWQDFMFANMDYPESDGPFLESVRIEVTQQLMRLRRHPAIAVSCGNSEVEQQAAMMGTTGNLWRSSLFSEVLPELCEALHPGTCYVPSTPSGGALPFHTGTGLAHYYGVGAYLRPLTDARRAGVRFTPECLGFANVPDRELVRTLMNDESPMTHDPRWKRGVPRDSGAGWDFEDVRDHYLRELYGVDPVRLRSVDTERYLDLSRLVTGEIMSQVFSEWRRPGSSCHGGLTWFLKDLQPGAGWGILDSSGVPKACFYYLRRAWQPQTLILTDEGLDGIHAHLLNESPDTLDADVDVSLLRDGTIAIAQATQHVVVPPRAALTLPADAMLGSFHDTAYAYRFGPPAHDVAVFRARRTSGETIAEAFHFPMAAELCSAEGAAVTASIREGKSGTWPLTIASDRFLYGVHFDVPGFLPDDNYFHLAPGVPRAITMRAMAARDKKPAGYVEAANLSEPVRIVLAE